MSWACWDNWRRWIQKRGNRYGFLVIPVPFKTPVGYNLPFFANLAQSFLFGDDPSVWIFEKKSIKEGQTTVFHR